MEFYPDEFLFAYGPEGPTANFYVMALDYSVSRNVYSGNLNVPLRPGDRPLTDKELGEFSKKFGFHPVVRPDLKVGGVVRDLQDYENLPVGKVGVVSDSIWEKEFDGRWRYCFHWVPSTLYTRIVWGPIRQKTKAFRIGDTVEGDDYSHLPVGARVASGAIGSNVWERTLSGMSSGFAGCVPISSLFHKRTVVALPGISEEDVARAKRARLAYWEALGEPRKSEPKPASLAAWIAAVKA